MRCFPVFGPSILLLCGIAAFGQQPADQGTEAAAIVEIGGAASTDLPGGNPSFGPNVAVEVTPIEHWLELEMGVTPLFRRHRSAEWDTDLLFKKPWTISKQFEIMAGVGPEWVYTRVNGGARNSLAGEAAIDLMIWPGSKRRFGLFVEPSYDYNFASGHEKSFSVTAGLLIAIW